jgi:hypothetical protein
MGWAEELSPGEWLLSLREEESVLAPGSLVPLWSEMGPVAIKRAAPLSLCSDVDDKYLMSSRYRFDLGAFWQPLFSFPRYSEPTALWIQENDTVNLAVARGRQLINRKRNAKAALTGRRTRA